LERSRWGCRLMANDFDDIEYLVKTYGKEVLRICRYYLRNSQDAEDAFQEVFIKLIRKRSTFCGKSELKTWLTRIAINTCKDFLKSRSLRNSTDESLLDCNDCVDVSKYNEYDELYQIITTLPLDYKDVILLKYYYGYTSKEIARILKLTEPAVNSRLHRAKNYLKKILTEKGWSDYEYLD